MKTKLIFFGILCFNLSFGQANLNQTVQNVQTGIINPIGAQFPSPVTAANPSGFQEIFRFRSGLVTQLDLGNNFDLSLNSPLNSRWFSIGSLNTGAQTVYGLRFQDRDKALIFGYNNVNNINPRIQWIGSGAALGNLEFRAADSFTSTNSLLVASLTGDGRTVFGDISSTGSDANNVKMFVENDKRQGVIINSLPFGSANSTGLSIFTNAGFDRNVGSQIITKDGRFNTGINLSTEGGAGSIGVNSFANGGVISYAVLGKVRGEGFFDIGIYGDVENNKGNVYAGYFNGDVTVTGTFNNPSDSKLKENRNSEKEALQKIMQLQPQTYTFKNFSEINLGKGLQHGFISQDLAKVYPELTTDIKKPIIDKDGNQTSVFQYKSINYIGLISILTAGIQELNTELQLLKEEIAALKTDKTSRKSIDTATPNSRGAFLQQNIPNPFGDQTTISYQLPEGTTAAEIMV